MKFRFNKKLIALIVFAAIIGSFNICFLHPETASAKIPAACSHEHKSEKSQENSFCIAHESSKIENSKSQNLDILLLHGSILSDSELRFTFESNTSRLFIFNFSPPEDADNLYSVFKKE